VYAGGSARTRWGECTRKHADGSARLDRIGVEEKVISQETAQGEVRIKKTG